MIVNKVYEKVVAVLSCKTSLRERMTEAAFWSRELKPKGIEVIFITTDKDEEVTSDVNRYIVMHVLDYTVITDPDRYNKIVEEWKLKYGSRSDFNVMMSKIISFNDIIKILQKYAS
ncbi:MAG: BsaWI family type II restriction enzyme [archaeon YNP-LCB-003-016]|uniref:BsaWI family type II restriction enzyme n=1 Tax=Candidatus Culexarchaeum yellowstonense TaxID=2928963 RepID=UPI0026EBE758|nr:BsaWI family type II restriction enzyme [Candidatus Culexarchaeum yellowstonense]MCR6693022.1 BsaWI family type II restriction enzyme [Candidatus Culexarchaeum yellowstonense]